VGAFDQSGQGCSFYEGTAVSVCETKYFPIEQALEPLRMNKEREKEKTPPELDSDDEFQLACLEEGEIEELDEFLAALDSPNVDAQMTLKPSELFNCPRDKKEPKKNKYLSREFLGERAAALSSITKGVQKTAISPPKKKDENCCVM